MTLRHRQQPFEATDIAGDLWVRNREIEAPALTGRALGGRWQASIATTVLGNGNLRTRVNAAGSLQGAALAPIARMPSNAGLVGTTDWRGSLDVERNADARQPARGTVGLSSDLRGLASALPAPFGKTAEASRPLALSASFDGRAGPRIEGSLGRDVHALLQWRSSAGAAPVERGIIAFGGAAADALPKNAGPLARRPRRIREPDPAARPQVGRTARAADPGMARRRGSHGRSLRGRRLRVRERQRPAAAG